MAESIEASGKTVAEALKEAARQLGCPQNEIEYTLIQKPSSGFFGLFGKHEAKIKACRRQDVAKVEQVADAADASEDRAAQKETSTAAASSVTEMSAKASETVASKPSVVEMPAETPETDVVSEPEKTAPRSRRTDEEREPRVPLDPEVAARAVDRGVAFLHDVFAAMHIEVSIERSDNEEGAYLSLIGDNLGILIGKHGQTLDALQYLANLAANRGLEDERVHILLDIEGYRARREETLTRLAGHLAEKACRIGQEIHLEPMNRHERKIIHMALQKSHRVSTYSAGDEPRRYVVIVPRKRPRRRYQSHSHDNEQG